MELGKIYSKLAQKLANNEVYGSTSNEEFVKLVSQHVRNMEKAHYDNIEVKGKKVYPHLNYVNVSVNSDDEDFCTLKTIYKAHKKMIDLIGLGLLCIVGLIVLKFVLLLLW